MQKIKEFFYSVPDDVRGTVVALIVSALLLVGALSLLSAYIATFTPDDKDSLAVGAAADTGLEEKETEEC